MTPIEDEQERREEIRRLEQENLRLDQETAHRNADNMTAKRQRAQNEAKALRLQFSAPSDDICPECWFDLGEHVPLTPQASGYGEDIYRCGNGHEHRVGSR